MHPSKPSYDSLMQHTRRHFLGASALGLGGPCPSALGRGHRLGLLLLLLLLRLEKKT